MQNTKIKFIALTLFFTGVKQASGFEKALPVCPASSHVTDVTSPAMFPFLSALRSLVNWNNTERTAITKESPTTKAEPTVLETPTITPKSTTKKTVYPVEPNALAATRYPKPTAPKRNGARNNHSWKTR